LYLENLKKICHLLICDHISPLPEKPGKLLTGAMKFVQLQYFMLSPPTAIG
jgi:hypothetical protein